MKSTNMNATTTENRVPNAAAQELDERNLEAVTGGIIIIGGSLASRAIEIEDFSFGVANRSTIGS